MRLNDFLASLSLGTMVVGALIIAAVLIYFLRRRSNRHPLEGRAERNVAADLDVGTDAQDHSPRQ